MKTITRDEALHRLTSQNHIATRDIILTSPALLGLLRIATSETSKISRKGIISNGSDGRMSADDASELIHRGLIEPVGKMWLAMTDDGNALVRDILEFSRAWEGGGK